MVDVIETGAAPEAVATEAEVKARNVLNQKARTVAQEAAAWERRVRRFVKNARADGYSDADIAAVMGAYGKAKGDTGMSRSFNGWHGKVLAVYGKDDGPAFARALVKKYIPRA
jgi:hypothetical protein